MAVPPVPVMVPELTMAPTNVATWFKTMPVCATIVPELVMPPAKVEIVTDAALRLPVAVSLAAPPTRMPAPAAVIVPELLMPPEKVEIVTDAVLLLPLPAEAGIAADPDAGTARRDRAGIADAAG